MKIAIDKNNVVYSIPDKHIENEVNKEIDSYSDTSDNITEKESFKQVNQNIK